MEPLSPAVEAGEASLRQTPSVVTSEADQIGALLIQTGLPTTSFVQFELNEQHRSGHSLGRVLIDNSLVSESDMVATLAGQLGQKFVDLSEYPVDSAAVTLVSESVARRYVAIPVGWGGGGPVVAVAE